MTMDSRQAATWLDEHNIAWVKTEGISIDGLVIGKHLSTRKFLSSLPLGNAVTELVLGYDIGGGLNIFLAHAIGVRGDIRHLHTLQDITLGLFSNDQIDFWRASAGLTLRF